MNLLAIDTSSKYFCLAVAKGDTIVAQFHKPLGAKLSRLILPTIDKALKKSGISIRRINYFAVGLGPGSFTGLRVGLATIKGLAFFLRQPIIGIVSLDALARSMNKFDGLTTLTINPQASRRIEGYICPIVDAKRRLVYSAIYSVNGKLRRRSKYLLAPIEGLLKEIGKKHKVFFLGDGISLYHRDITKKLGKAAIFADESFWYPKPENLIALAREKIKNREFDNPDKIVPLYLYPKECQINTVV